MPKMRIPATPKRMSKTVTALLALTLTVAVHGALCLLTGYRPAAAATPQCREAGVMLLVPDSLPEEAREPFRQWFALHDPALAVRSDNPHNYAALLPEPEVRNYRARRPAETLFPASRPELPAFRPVSEGAGEHARNGIARNLLPFPPSAAPARGAVPAAFDESGAALAVAPAVPDGERAARPTVIRLRNREGIVRRQLMESSGNAALDRAAMAALAELEEPAFTTVTVYWPTGGGAL